MGCTSLLVTVHKGSERSAGAVLYNMWVGEVSEWLKEHAWKACVPAMVPRVRIPLSPPGEKDSDLLVWVFLFWRKDLNPKGSVE